MSFLNLYIFICAYSIHILYAHVEQFINNSIYEVTAFNDRERATLYNVYLRAEQIVFVNKVTNEAALPMYVLVKALGKRDFESMLRSNDIEYVNASPENAIKKLGDISTIHQEIRGILDPTKNFFCFDKMREWVEQKIKKNAILQEIKLGKTYEKRDIFVLKISTGEKNKAVFLMGGEEAKDWTSPAILLNFVTYILEKKLNLEILIQHFDFYVLPLLNPDGYMYSMLKNRMWSKNCKVYFPKKPCSGNASVVGISVERNWYFDKLTVRNEECDTIYIGSKPLSEEETKAVSRFLNEIALKMMVFINIRGFNNLVTIPYGYENKYCNNYDVLMDMLSAVHDAVYKKHNITFNYGVTSKYLYNFSGNVADWVKKQLNTPVVYTFHMKNGPHIFPDVKNVQPLTEQLGTMIKEISLLANTFYGPLFNSQFKCSISFFILVLNCCFFLYTD